MKRYFLISVVTMAVMTGKCYAQNQMKTPMDIGKAVYMLLKNSETIDYSEFSGYFVNAQDCRELAGTTTNANYKQEFQKTADSLANGNYYNGYQSFTDNSYQSWTGHNDGTYKSFSASLSEWGYDISGLSFVDFFNETVVNGGVPFVIGFVVMKSGNKYLIAEPTAVKLYYGYKLITLNSKVFIPATAVKADGNVYLEDGGSYNLKELLKEWGNAKELLPHMAAI